MTDYASGVGTLFAYVTTVMIWVTFAAACVALLFAA
jgi:hypothetical protein